MITSEEKERYGRQILIEDIGGIGQEKLKKARVFVAGAGGLGSPICLYLAAAGVGYLRVVDQDEVSLSNLNRQILYRTTDIGRKKAETAAENLNNLNPAISVEPLVESITEDTVFDITDGCDLILDALDNFSARYLLNDVSLKRNIPYIYGGVYGLEGALTTIVPSETPCLKCIFPVAPKAAVAPVLGAAPGIIGCLQAMEAIKYILGIGRLLTNRLLVFDGFSMKFREIKVSPDPKCTCCSSFSPSGGRIVKDIKK